MANRFKAEVAGLNLRLHPHSPTRYRELWKAAFSRKKIIKMRGDRSGLITVLSRISDDSEYVNGVLSTFLEIDWDGTWLDTNTLAEAKDDEVAKISVPDNLRPNAMNFYFRFDIKNHEIIFEHYGSGHRLTINSALNFFSNLFRDVKLKKEFGDVKITIIQNKGSIDKIFSIPRITNIEVYIERPNSDIWDGDFEELAEEHLEDKNARSMTVIYKSEPGLGIERDDDLDALVRTSIRNGRTVAKGYGPNGHETVTTDEFPKIMQGKFDPEFASDSTAFQHLADQFRRR